MFKTVVSADMVT